MRTTILTRIVLGAALALALLAALRGPATPAADAASDRLLGGLNLDAYCQAHGGLGSAVRYGKWVCYAQNNFDVDFQAACQWAYNTPAGIAAFPVTEPNNPLAVNCYTGSSRLLGGLNLKAYCQVHNFGGVTVSNNQFTCSPPLSFTLHRPFPSTIDMTDACVWTYGAGAFPAAPQGNHLIVNCFR